MIVCGLVLTGSAGAGSLNDGSVEYGVKLAFIYNLTKFVEWPSNSTVPFSVGIVGSDPFSPELEDELRTREVRGRRIVLKQLKAGDKMSGCQIVFIPVTAKDQAASIVKALNGTSTLTISETEGFARLGGIINFAVAGNRLRVEVNPLAAKRAGLKISSKFLKIATIVSER